LHNRWKNLNELKADKNSKGLCRVMQFKD